MEDKGFVLVSENKIAWYKPSENGLVISFYTSMENVGNFHQLFHKNIFPN